MKLLSRVSLVLAAAFLLVLLATLAGALHPAADSFAVFRPELAVATLALAAGSLALRRSMGAGGIAVLAGGLGLTTAPVPRVTASDGPTFVLYQKNLSFRLADPDALLADIRDADPDFVTLQEVTKRLRPVVASTGLRSRHLCDFAGVGGVAVASKWPKVPGTASCAEGVAMMQVTTPSGPIWVASVHLHWPWPYKQAGQVAAVWPKLETQPGPWVIGGDFNAVPWSHTVRDLARRTDTRVASGHRRTFDLRWWPIPIDHVLVPRGAAIRDAEQRPLLGSDHRGLKISFTAP